MFKDIRILLDNVREETKYEIKDGEIYYTINLKYNYKNLTVFFDENIYSDITFLDDINSQKESNNRVIVQIKDIPNKKITFKVTINYKYFIKSIYKYMNKFINKNKLLDELIFFENSIAGKKYKKDIELLIEKIDDKSIDELIVDSDKEQERIESILLESTLFSTLTNKMTYKDLMLLITSYICVGRPPKVDQDTFNAMVKETINYQDSLENAWRLGMNYDGSDLDFSLLDEFFVNSKDIWYLGEYLTGVIKVNQEKITNLIIATKDNDYIKKLLEDEFINDHLEEKYKNILKKALNNL